MEVLARFALPGILALSAIGALIVGVLLVRYGFVVQDEEDADDAEHRMSAMRIAHALVAVCLAGVAVLAVAALVARPAAAPHVTTAGPPPSAPEASKESAARDDAAGPSETVAPPTETATASRETATVSDEAAAPPREAAPEQRPDRKEAPATLALPQRAETRAETPSRTIAPRRAAVAPPAPAPASSEDVAALPVLVGKPQMSTTIQGVRVDVHRQPGDGHDTVYTIRLLAAGNQPLTGADVSLLGRSADGLTVRAALVPAREPGFYRARVAAQSAQDLRLRVVHANARFEVPLDRPVSW